VRAQKHLIATRQAAAAAADAEQHPDSAAAAAAAAHTEGAHGGAFPPSAMPAAMASPLRSVHASGGLFNTSKVRCRRGGGERQTDRQREREREREG
jgi:hypothetical protein